MSADPAAARQPIPPPQGAQVVPIDDMPALRLAGLTWPKTRDSWRHLYRTRASKQFGPAFLRVGNRILVDVPAFIACCRRARA